MATHTTARRPQRSSRRATGAAHARSHREVGSLASRAGVAPALAPAAPALDPIPAVVLEEAEKTKPTAAPKALRTPDSDDHLAAYFRQLAEHDLLTPEDERELSQGIEDTEILTWERVFARPDVVRALLALVEPNLEEPQKFPKLQ